MQFRAICSKTLRLEAVRSAAGQGAILAQSLNMEKGIILMRCCSLARQTYQENSGANASAGDEEVLMREFEWGNLEKFFSSGAGTFSSYSWEPGDIEEYNKKSTS